MDKFGIFQLESPSQTGKLHRSDECIPGPLLGSGGKALLIGLVDSTCLLAPSGGSLAGLAKVSRHTGLLEGKVTGVQRCKGAARKALQRWKPKNRTH